MRSVTLSMRVTKAEAGKLEQLAVQVGLDRSTLLKQALRKGCADVIFEKACEAYRRGDVTLSRAAEMADLSLREMLRRLPASALELNYSVQDLTKDLKQ